MYDWPTDKRQGHTCVPPPKAPAGGGCALPYVEVSNSGPCEVKLELFNVPEWAENTAIQGIFPGGVRFYDCNNGDQLSRSAIPPEVTCIIIKIPAAGAISNSGVQWSRSDRSMEQIVRPSLTEEDFDCGEGQ